MKLSNYNLFFDYDSEHVTAYNSFSNALALMKKENHQKLEAFRDHSLPIDDEQLIEDLTKGNFLIPINFDEKKHLQQRMYKGRYASEGLGLTIATTADCNFRCPYCYEKGRYSQTKMDEKIQERLVQFVKNQAPTLSNLSITWYGGEPLLAPEVIWNLSEQFISICEEYNITYNAGMVTNGYFLTSKNCELLAKAKVSFLQVTLDGDKETHDKMRPLTNGGGTFERIMDNLINNFDALPHVSLRVNVDKHNVGEATKIIDLLKDHNLLHKIKPYLGKITPDNNTYSRSSCLNTCDFSEEEFEYAKALDPDKPSRFPRLIGNFCTADKEKGFVVGPGGEIYKCWQDIGNETRVVHSLADEPTPYSTTFLDYIGFDPTEDSMCSSCDLLPICMGGCPYQRLKNEEDRCINYKYVMDKVLKGVVTYLKAEKSKQATTPAA